MSEKILVPVLGESITEATVSKWLKKEGDSVEADEPVVELETDKVNLEVPAPSDGVISEINFKDGSTVEVGAHLGSVSNNGTATIKKQKIEEQPKKENIEINKSIPEENNVVNLEIPKKEIDIFEEKVDEEEPLILTEEVKEKKVQTKVSYNLSPSVRKIVAEKKNKS